MKILQSIIRYIMKPSAINDYLKELGLSSIRYITHNNDGKPIKVNNKIVKGIYLNNNLECEVSSEDIAFKKLKTISNQLVSKGKLNKVHSLIIETLFPVNDTLTVKLGKTEVTLDIVKLPVYETSIEDNPSKYFQNVAIVSYNKSRKLIKVGM